jgi:hypothetical protein
VRPSEVTSLVLGLARVGGLEPVRLSSIGTGTVNLCLTDCVDSALALAGLGLRVLGHGRSVAHLARFYKASS